MAKKTAKSQSQSPRAQRFTVRLLLRYRPAGCSGWVEGTTENISRTGVLFGGNRMFAVGTKLQLSLTLPLKANVPLTVTVLCRGQVARVHAPKGSLPRIGAK